MKTTVVSSINIKLVNSPLAENYLTYLRDSKTPYTDFRNYMDKISLIIASRCSEELKLKKKNILTPLEKFTGNVTYQNVVLVPVLRAGLGFIDGFMRVFNAARVSHIGIYRNEKTLKPIRYYFRFPKTLDKKNTVVFILDPMLATGGTMNSTITTIKKQGINNIILVTLLCSPKGIKEIEKVHKNMIIYTCAIDQRLDKNGYIVPGLGDAGDRIFGT